ncbi:MAG: hypothetical protein ACR2KC_05580 [Acidimicrobiales bacterium]
MKQRWRVMVATIAVASAGLLARPALAASPTISPYPSSPPAGTVLDCVGPAGAPAPGTVAWQLRDLANQACATRRLQDQLTNPAFAQAFAEQTPGIFATQSLAMVASPTHLHLTLGQLVPGGTTADPFRTLALWIGARRGRVQPVSFDASDGAQLNGNLFSPPASVAGPYPGVVITTGSIQGYQQMYFWAAEGLAEAGYMVLTYDVQGQGDSDTLPANCQPSPPSLQQGSVCTGVPFQQPYNFFQGTEDALGFFVSTPSHAYRSVAAPGVDAYNPQWSSLNRSEVGLAGHSLGASAVSQVGQCDPRVKAVVAWDNLAPATACTGSGAPTLRTPALGFNSEYFFNPEPMTSAPDPHAKDQAYRQLVGARIDTMQVALRSSTHLEYSYVPYILPASSLGERVAFYYTLAWFDYELRHQSGGYQRLVATRFDRSADAHSIGAGGYSPTAGNVAYRIGGLPVADRLSFYYLSSYDLRQPAGPGRTVCPDMSVGCR